MHTQTVQAAAAVGHAIPGWMWIPCVSWIVLVTFVTAKLFHRPGAQPSLRKATLEVVVWLVHTTIIGAVFWTLYGAKVGGQFFSGFTVENALSVDNILIWAAVLAFFGIPKEYRPRILSWGVYGAIILRAGFIVAGLSLIHACLILMLPLGAYLAYTAYKISKGDDSFNAEENRIVKFFQARGWVSEKLDGAKFFTTEAGRLIATKLLVVLVIIELVDVLFAFDSVPVVLVVTGNTLVAWMSNMCAVLGLRALFYVYSVIEDKLWALGYGVTIVLLYIGVTTFLQPSRLSPLPWKWVGLDVPVSVNLSVIAGVLALSVIVGLIRPKKDEDASTEPVSAAS